MKIGGAELIESNFKGHGFQIQASKKAFEILSNGLYQNKELAIIRELISNSYDSHIMANQSKPIELIISTDFDGATFTLRDYGVGIHPDKMLKMYATYFDSTKTETNEQIGGFGLGSKTPFALVDSFMVTTTQDGKDYKYACTKGAGGPEILELGVSDNEEFMSGFTVSFTCSRDIGKRLLNTAIHFLSNCDDIIELTLKSDGSVINYHKRESEDIQLKPRKDHGMMIRMGLVCYPINRQHLFNKGLIDQRELNLSNIPCILTLPIGALEPTVSREELSMDEDSSILLAKEVKRCINNVVDKIKNSIQEDNDFKYLSTLYCKLTELVPYNSNAIKLEYFFDKFPDIKKWEDLSFYNLYHKACPKGDARITNTPQMYWAYVGYTFKKTMISDSKYNLPHNARIKVKLTEEDYNVLIDTFPGIEFFMYNVDNYKIPTQKTASVKKKQNCVSVNSSDIFSYFFTGRYANSVLEENRDKRIFSLDKEDMKVYSKFQKGILKSISPKFLKHFIQRFFKEDDIITVMTAKNIQRYEKLGYKFINLSDYIEKCIVECAPKLNAIKTIYNDPIDDKIVGEERHANIRRKFKYKISRDDIEKTEAILRLIKSKPIEKEFLITKYMKEIAKKWGWLDLINMYQLREKPKEEQQRILKILYDGMNGKI